MIRYTVKLYSMVLFMDWADSLVYCQALPQITFFCQKFLQTCMHACTRYLYACNHMYETKSKTVVCVWQLILGLYLQYLKKVPEMAFFSSQRDIKPNKMFFACQRSGG